MKKQTNEELLNIITGDISSIKVIHQVYKEFQNMKKKTPLGVKGLKNHFGKWQYFYYNKNGCISLIRLESISWYKNKYMWEIYSGETVTEDTMRFTTKKEAEKEIEKVLDGEITKTRTVGEEEGAEIIKRWIAKWKKWKENETKEL